MRRTQAMQGVQGVGREHVVGPFVQLSVTLGMFFGGGTIVGCVGVVSVKAVPGVYVGSSKSLLIRLNYIA